MLGLKSCLERLRNVSGVALRILWLGGPLRRNWVDVSACATCGQKNKQCDLLAARPWSCLVRTISGEVPNLVAAMKVRSRTYRDGN